MPEVFKAQAQYGDWVGDAHADDADLAGIRAWIADQGLLKEGETVVGVKFYAGAHDFISIKALVVPENTYDTSKAYIDAKRAQGAIPLRQVDLALTAAEFLRHFKRFSVVLGVRGLLQVGDE